MTYGPARRPLSDRFWERVDKSPGFGPKGECWQWTGTFFTPVKRMLPYGAIVAGGTRGKLLKAHRVSWSLHNGQIPEGLLVCHSCDHPPCVNPDHLFLGTHKMNSMDKNAKGRDVPPKGVRNGQAKLTEAQAREIFASTEPTQVLVARYGVHKVTICDIRAKRQWKCLHENTNALAVT